MSKPNIVILETQPFDADGDLDFSPLHALGDLTLYPRTLPHETAERLADAEIAFTNKVRIGAAEMDAARNLRLISVLATGHDVVDSAAAKERNITVCNVPGYSTPSTAQTTIALLLELCHHVGEHAATVRDGGWTRAGIWSFWEKTPLELEGKTLVLIGLGAVGMRVARIAEALGMSVHAAAIPNREYEPDTAYPRLPLETALAEADVVSLHCPLTPETRHLMNAERLALLKPTALLVNTARGLLVDETALADALRSGRLTGYAADVLSVEPPPPDNPLLSAPNCLITPHFAWASRASRSRLLAESIENVRAFLSGSPRNVVNR
jgi:glycerate dehydrogenase